MAVNPTKIHTRVFSGKLAKQSNASLTERTDLSKCVRYFWLTYCDYYLSIIIIILWRSLLRKFQTSWVENFFYLAVLIKNKLTTYIRIWNMKNGSQLREISIQKKYSSHLSLLPIHLSLPMETRLKFKLKHEFWILSLNSTICVLRVLQPISQTLFDLDKNLFKYTWFNLSMLISNKEL